jgi:carbonic anhydrase
MRCSVHSRQFHEVFGSLVIMKLSTVLRHDVPASLVVFLVAVPLSLGIALASGAPIVAGLIAAIVGGVVASALGGSALQVSGPAAGLTVVMAETINTFGWATTCAITVAAGGLQILLGLSRIARRRWRSHPRSCTECSPGSV